MRILSFLVLALISIIEVGPVPITPVLLIYVVLFRPIWFYEWVLKVYGKD